MRYDRAGDAVGKLSCDMLRYRRCGRDRCRCRPDSFHVWKVNVNIRYEKDSDDIGAVAGHSRRSICR